MSSFPSIVTSTTTYEPRETGVYAADTANFGEPTNIIRIRPNTSKKQPSFTLTRTREVDLVSATGATTQRVSGSIQIMCSVPPKGFTSTDIASMIDDLAKFASSTNLNLVLQGKA